MKAGLLVIFLIIFFNLNAQQGTVTSGGVAIGNNGTISYTIGQIFYYSYNGSSKIISDGLQQPYEISEIFSNSNISLKMKVFPNPIKSFVILRIENLDRTTLECKLIDASGKVLSNQKVTQVETRLAMDYLPSAVYFLSVTDSDRLIKSFKIVKNN